MIITITHQIGLNNNPQIELNKDASDELLKSINDSIGDPNPIGYTKNSFVSYGTDQYILTFDKIKNHVLYIAMYPGVIEILYDEKYDHNRISYVDFLDINQTVKKLFDSIMEEA